MAENSKIEWTHHTFNPWIGCQKVGPGCDHCYAEAKMDVISGEQYRVVNAGNSAWSGFCAVLAAMGTGND